jgi:uncharacterized membrane protein
MKSLGFSTPAAARFGDASIAQVSFDAPWAWLAAGWRDMWQVPRISLAYGLAFAGISALLASGLLVGGFESLILALAGGFLLIGPIAAVGLYETSRRLESAQRIVFGEMATSVLQATGQLAFFGAILAFLFLVWVQLAFLLLMLFLGNQPLPPASQFIPTLLFTPQGLGLLAVGTIVGGLLALAAFAISAISVPLLMTRRIDAVSAMAASLSAVVLNPKPMLLWAGLIAGFMALGVATLFAGLVIVFPLIGHATWHAYRDLVRDSGSSSYL